MYFSINKTMARAGSMDKRRQLLVARKMMLIILTDLLCWLPIIAIGKDDCIQTLGRNICVCFTLEHMCHSPKYNVKKVSISYNHWVNHQITYQQHKRSI